MRIADVQPPAAPSLPPPRGIDCALNREDASPGLYALFRLRGVAWGTARPANKEKRMKVRRLVPLALAAYAGWKRMSPQRRASLKNKITGITRKAKPPQSDLVSG